MKWFGVIVAAALMAVVLIDAFEVVLLPRRVRHGFRLARLFYRTSWMIGRTAARLLPPGRWRTGFLGAFGPLSLFVLVVLWAVGLITGFALLHWSLGTALSVADAGFGAYLYFSGTTFFTLGYGDMVPLGTAGRALSVAESGVGFVFLAVIVSYLPVLYQAFSRIEISIALLDARAGSPPSAGELLRRLAAGRSPSGPGPFLVEWERWAADLLESHISFPVLSYYRSQHENQSWVGSLTAILDTCAAAGGRGRAGRLPGPADIRHGAARGGGPGVGVPNAAAAAAARPAVRGGPRPTARVALRGRDEDARGAGGGHRACRVAGPVRAVRQRPGHALPVHDAAFPAGKAAGGQLANQSLDAALAGPRRPARGTRRGRPLRLISGVTRKRKTSRQPTAPILLACHQ